MVGKRGWLRIVEAFIAVLIIAGVIIVILSGRIGQNLNRDEAIYNLQKTILDEIQNNNSLRKAVFAAVDTTFDDKINEDDGGVKYNEIKTFIRSKIPGVFDFEVQICISDIKQVCAPREYKKELYAEEAIISSTLDIYEPRKLKLFIWDKE